MFTTACGGPHPAGGVLRRVVRLNLPQRLSKVLPRPLTELVAGVAIAGLFVVARTALTPLSDEVAPFALTFLALVLAALVAGWRSGFVALATSQLAIWYFLLPPKGSFALSSQDFAYSLLVTSGTGLLILLALGLYEREVKLGDVERARRINFLRQALREMDHRTRNNFQIVTSLLTLQGSRSGNADVQSALKEAAERLKAVAAVYDSLAPSSQGLAMVRLQDQLEEMCEQIRRGILPERIALTAEIEPMLVPHDTAVAIGIVVNELITNACKHAFDDGGGEIRVRALGKEGAAQIEVADNGKGFDPSARRKSGLGTRLVAAFVQRIGGRSEVRSSPEGTVYSLLVPLR